MYIGRCTIPGRARGPLFQVAWHWHCKFVMPSSMTSPCAEALLSRSKTSAVDTTQRGMGVIITPVTRGKAKTATIRSSGLLRKVGVTARLGHLDPRTTSLFTTAPSRDGVARGDEPFQRWQRQCCAPVAAATAKVRPQPLLQKHIVFQRLLFQGQDHQRQLRPVG